LSYKIKKQPNKESWKI